MVTQQQLQEAVSYILSIRPSPYILWQGGDVSAGDGPPAWAVNAPAPAASYVQPRGGFCVAVKSLMERYLGVSIPTINGDEDNDGGIWSTWNYHYANSEWFQFGVDYPNGTLVMSPYEGEALSSQGHIGMIWHWQNQMYVIEWILNGGLTWDYTLEESNEWGSYQIAIRPEKWLPLSDAPAPSPAPITIPTRYPGDSATPLQMAAWMDYVSRTEFGISGIVPVTCSATELTQAWEGPGNVRDVPGYDYAVDHASLGWFQQQVGIWDGGQPGIGATYDQIMNPEWSLRSFLTVATQYKGKYSQTDPEAIGEWCQAVQNSGVPDAYVERGYPTAKALMDQIPQGGDTPVPDPVPTPDDNKQPWQLWGWYDYESASSWNLSYHPPEGGTSPVPTPEPEWKKARRKQPEIVQFQKKDGEVEVQEDDGTTLLLTEEQFSNQYEETS